MRFLSFRASVLFFVIAAGWPMPSVAQSGWFWQNQSPTGNDIRAVATPAPGIVVAVGPFGTVLRTTDAGATWMVQSVGTSNHLAAVYFVNANIGWAVGTTDSFQALILHTTDGAATWRPRTAGSPGSSAASTS